MGEERRKEEEEDGKFEAGDVCQNFSPFVRSFAPFLSLPTLLSRVLTPLREVRHPMRSGERRGRGDVTIRRTREKKLNAFETKSLVGPGKVKQAGWLAGP